MSLTHSLSSALDVPRSFLIALFLQNNVLRNIYTHRHLRHFALIFLSMMVSTVLACAFPLWMLLLGPAFFGFPHWIASIRYSSLRFVQSVRKTFVIGAVTVSVLVAVIRLLEIRESINIENCGLLVFFAVMAAHTWNTFRFSKSVLLVVLVLFFGFIFPSYTAGFLILFHNFAAFLFWYKCCQNQKEKTVALGATLLFLAIHLIIFMGYLDSLTLHFSPSGTIPFLNTNVWEVGNSILPFTSIGPRMWMRACVAYAFGQSVHYVVWLRIIPESVHKNVTPTSFRQSRVYYYKDLGLFLGRFLLGAASLFSLIWICFKFSDARLMYLALVSFHGYSEFTSLCFQNKAST